MCLWAHHSAKFLSENSTILSPHLPKYHHLLSSQIPPSSSLCFFFVLCTNLPSPIGTLRWVFLFGLSFQQWATGSEPSELPHVIDCIISASLLCHLRYELILPKILIVSKKKDKPINHKFRKNYYACNDRSRPGTGSPQWQVATMLDFF